MALLSAEAERLDLDHSVWLPADFFATLKMSLLKVKGVMQLPLAKAGSFTLSVL